MNMHTKIPMDTELLLRWAFQDELSKRSTSSAEGIWDRIHEEGQRGGIDVGHSAAQRYPHFGLPDPDAERIERAIGQLQDLVIDWELSFDSIVGDLGGLVSINDITRRQVRPETPKASWGQSGDRALKAFWGARAAVPQHDRPRDVLMVGALRTAALVTQHATRGSRPDWFEETPKPEMVPALKGTNAMIVGECRGRNLYTIGSYCPLKWSPSPLSIISSRAEYVAWHRGLVTLAETLDLVKFAPQPPRASPTPWIDHQEDQEEGELLRNTVDEIYGRLPLVPARGRMGPPQRQKKFGPVRYIACG